MTPKEAIKFKEQIEYFIEHPEDGMFVFVYNIDSWLLTQCPDWDIDKRYVLPDEFAEFRKALSDGRQLQVATNDPKMYPLSFKWVDFDGEFKLPIERYRLKPEEPKISIGQWVNVVRDDGIIFSTRKFTYQDIEFSPPNGYADELWVPKVGEWVACSDDNYEYIVKQFKQQDFRRFLKVEPLEAIMLLRSK